MSILKKSLAVLLFCSVNLLANSNQEIEMVQELNKLNETKLEHFGKDLFKGNFKDLKINNFNSDYLINSGDTIFINIWGNENYTEKLTVDKSGNIFIPKIGVVNVRNIKNSELNAVINKAVKEKFPNGIEVYSTLETFQPIQIFVSGNIFKPGLYEGNSSDSILQFIDKAGGIKESGSYREIFIKRDNKIVKSVDLYDFLLNGSTINFLFQNGDVILIDNKLKEFSLLGSIERPYIYEFKDNLDIKTILNRYGNITPDATGVIIERLSNKEKKYFKFDINSITNFDFIEDGDKVIVTSDFSTDNISINISGETKSDSNLLFKDGIYLSDVIKTLNLTSDSDLENIIVYRKSVAIKQQELLNYYLDNLEKKLLNQPNDSLEIAKLSEFEKKTGLDFIKKAREIKQKGFVSLGKNRNYNEFKMEDGDKIYIPKKTDIVFVQGEVSFPSAHIFSDNLKIKDYIEKSGDFTENSNEKEVLVFHLNGEVSKYDLSGWITPDAEIKKGDSIVVQYKVEDKNIQLWKDFTKIFYNIAISTGVLITLF